MPALGKDHTIIRTLFAKENLYQAPNAAHRNSGKVNQKDTPRWLSPTVPLAS